MQNVRHHRTQVPPLFRQQRTALENTWHSGECDEAPDPPKLLQRAEVRAYAACFIVMIPGVLKH